MKITNTQISMQSQHSSVSYSSKSESLQLWKGNQPLNLEASQKPALASQPRIEISSAALATQAADIAAAQAAQEAHDELDPRIALLVTIIEMMTGKKVEIFHAADIATPNASLPEKIPANSQQEAGKIQQLPDFGMEYNATSIREESEQTSFSATGRIQTADGRSIDFQLTLQLGRHFREETSVSLRAGNARRKDPLVINFGGNSAQLQSQTFRFDLNGDGTSENLAMLGSGSGYLALDKNGNGKIDSGKELLGPESGSGFADLTQLDSDGNGWVDESDAAFNLLKVWMPTADGAAQLLSLKEAGVGALYTGRADTPFELRGSGQQDLGALKETGLYLSEDGRLNTLQEIDLTI